MHTTLVVNPRSGKNRGLSVAQVVAQELERLGHPTLISATHHAGHAPELVRDALANGSRRIVAVGGDGTLAEILAGVAGETDLAVGICPVGTANVVAREFGIPLKDPVGAARIVANGHLRKVDFGFANGKPFLANCGVGFDARVVRRIHLARRRTKKALSMTGYILPGLIEFARYDPGEFRVSVDGKPLAGVFASVEVSNCRNYGGVMSVTPDADPCDGQLDIHARRTRGRLGLVLGFAAAILRRRESRAAAEYLRGRHVEIRSTIRNPVQVDGDAFRATPLIAEISSTPVLLIVPPSAKERR